MRSFIAAVLVLTSATAGSAPAYALRPERAGVEEIRAALAGTEELQPVEVIRPAAVDRLNLRAVVWDFDDTLWNGFPRDLEASEIGRWLGKDPGQVYGFMMDTNGLSWDERVAEMRKLGWEVPEDWKAAEDRFRQMLRNAIRDEKRTAPEYLVLGAAELLAAFHEAFFQASGKRRQAVATGGAADSRYQYADDLGIRKYFEFIRGGGHKGQTIADMLYNWWLAPNELAFISDSEPDIRTAKQAGVLAVGFAATPEIRRKLIAAGADVIIGHDYRAKQLILDTLKLRRPAVAGAGVEEAATPANVQRVLDLLKPKILPAQKSKEKSTRAWAREAEQVYGLLENDLPLLKTATGNSPRDQEIKQRAAAFLKRANDLLARAPNAGAEEPIRLDDLEIGRKLISPDGQTYFVFQAGPREAVLLPVITEGENVGISLEAEGIVRISSDEQLAGWRRPPTTAGTEEGPVHVTLSIGGTKIAVGVTTASGILGAKEDQPTPLTWQQLRARYSDMAPLGRSVQGILDQVLAALEYFHIDQKRLDEVAISWAGPGDYEQGIVGNEKLTPDGLGQAVDLKGNLETVLTVKFSRPIRVRFMHDGAAGAFGEKNLPEGALYGFSERMAIIFGTGVGAGIIQDGRPLYAVPGKLQAFLGEFGWHLVRQADGTYSYRGINARPGVPFPDKPKLGEWSFEQQIAGPWLAARFVQRIRDNRLTDEEIFGQKIELAEDQLMDLGETRRPIVADEPTQRKVLETITLMALADNPIARDFINETGEEFGRAIRVFLETFSDQKFSGGRVVLISSLGERFGAGVTDSEGGDLFLAAVRRTAGTDDVVRSRLGYEREFAFSMPSAAGTEELSWLARFTPPAIVAAAVGIAVAGDIALEEKAVPAAKVTLEKRKVTVKDLPEDLLKGRKAAFLLIENDQNAEPGIWYFQGKVPAGPWHFEVKDGAVEVVSRVDLRPKKAWIFLVKDAAAEKALRAAIKKLPGHTGEEGDSYVAFTFGRRDLPALLGNDALVRDTSLVAFRVEADRLIQWVPSNKAGVEEKVRVLQDKVDLVSVTTTPKNSAGEVARKQGEITKIVTRITVNDNSSVDYVHSSLDWALAIEHHRAVLRVTDITKAVAAARPDIFFAGLYALFPDSPTKPAAGVEEKIKPGDVHLLILDDDEGTRGVARRLVEPAARAAGIPLSQIHVVGTADEALRVVEEFKPQFGILDRNVKDPAGRTGIDVARAAVKAGGPLTRMVLVASLTTDAQVEEKDRELQPGGALAGFVEKPYRIDGPLSYHLQRFLKDRVESPAAGLEENRALVGRAVASNQLGVPFREGGRTRTVVQVPASPEPMAMQLFVQAGLDQPEGLPETVWIRAYPAALAAAVRLLESNPPLKGAFFLLNNQVVNQQTAAAWLPATEHRAALVDPRVSGQDLGRLIQQIAALAALAEKNGQILEINSIMFIRHQQGTFAIIESA